MPAVNFLVRWPDGEEELCYSPSTIVYDFIKPGAQFTLDEFMRVSRLALTSASERVRERFGFACSSADDQLLKICHRIDYFKKNNTTGIITIVRMEQ